MDEERSGPNVNDLKARKLGVMLANWSGLRIRSKRFGLRTADKDGALWVFCLEHEMQYSADPQGQQRGMVLTSYPIDEWNAWAQEAKVEERVRFGASGAAIGPLWPPAPLRVLMDAATEFEFKSSLYRYQARVAEQGGWTLIRVREHRDPEMLVYDRGCPDEPVDVGDLDPEAIGWGRCDVALSGLTMVLFKDAICVIAFLDGLPDDLRPELWAARS